MILHHGTSTLPPHSLYSSEEGFNINYSNEGMWGKAIYFAVNSSYSNSYSSKLPSGERQMFHARVIIGNTIVMNPDGKLREPPMKADGTARHDSVQGFTGNSDVFMVYSNKKAYPEYLITYKP